MTHDRFKLLEEILSMPRFREWCLGEAPETDDFWTGWADGDPVRTEVLEYAKEITRSFQDKIQPVSEAYIFEKVSLAISAARNGDGVSPSRAKDTVWISFAKVAASVLLIMALGWGAYLYYDHNYDHRGPALTETSSLPAGSAAASRFITVQNTGDFLRHVHLSDGSSVILQPGSRIRFPEIFPAGKREVHLSGEAFFEVVKNKKAPFYVLANEAITKVVGTSFRVKAKPGVPFLEVNVKSGTVVVFKDKMKDGYDVNAYPDDRVTVLNKNEKAIFELSGAELLPQAELRDMPARLPIEKLGFVYESTPLSDVFAELEAAYGVKINYNSEQLAGCSLTAELSDEPLFTKIKWIAAILEADYTITDNEIIINGKPCQ